MNGVALLLAAASLAVDYSWEKSAAGQVEYMIRVEAEVVPSLVSGEEIHSDVPAEAGTVDRFRLRIGIDGNQPVFTPAAPGRLGTPPDRSAMLVKSGAAAVETQAVSFGWQPSAEGKLLYYVQIDPSLLRTLEVGDEIQAAVDTSAGPVGTFIVSGGNKQLPRIPTGTATTATSPPSRFSPDAETSPATGSTTGGTRFGGFDNSTAPAAATTPEPGTSRFGGTTTNTNTPNTGAGASPSPLSRFGGNTAPDTATPPPAGQSRFDNLGTGSGAANSTDTRPGGFNPPSLEPQSPAGQFGTGNTGRNSPATNPPSSGSDLYPGNGQTGGFRNPPAQNQPGWNYDNRVPLDPPQGNFANRPLPPAGQSGQQPSQSNNNVAPPTGNDRTAMVDQNQTRGAGNFTTQQPVAAPAPQAAPTATAEAEKPWWWGWLVFFFCVMCLSIGGNLYLGWTAVEFYQRYQRAVERLRTGTTARA